MLTLHTQEKPEQAAPERPSDNAPPPAQKSPSDAAEGAEKPAVSEKTRKAGALDSLLKKFLPAADAARKK
ncbi:hypothetical protein D3C83_182780 [compost metagenome]